ncbi:Uncharacterised protein [Mycobacteroides abscessus subsp. abscessus]|nr:Uncharacterised protein [Mycobacteroides abscessus subsp. abscessus]
MVARSQFWYDAAIFSMQFNLAVQHLSAQTQLAVIQRKSCFITRRFQA